MYGFCLGLQLQYGNETERFFKTHYVCTQLKYQTAPHEEMGMED